MKNILTKNCDNRLEFLKEQFPECFDREGNLNIQKFQEIVEPSNKLFKDSYGLNWLGKTYARKLAELPISTVLSEDKEHNEKKENENSENVYIKGDNLEVLRHLISAYRRQVKMIYIDPPYNTGNGDFVYNDNRSFTEKELDKLIEAKAIEENEKDRILSWIDKESSSHSAWLTFMFPRLYLARKLLKNDGVIFISIDDNEVSQLKLLCDEIFGEENNLSCSSWRRVEGKPGKSNYIGITNEYVLIYSRNKLNTKIQKLPPTEAGLKEFRYKDDKGKFRRGQIIFPDRGSYFYKVTTPYGNEIEGCFTLKYEELVKLDNEGRIYYAKKGDHTPYLKIYLEEYPGSSPLNTLNSEYGSSQSAVKEMRSLFEDSINIFNNPKPTKLISRLFQYLENKECLILDFFSGSATTAHAVMQLNAKDGGNRKYIMVQLEEEIKAKINSKGIITKTEALIFCEENNLPTNITSIGIKRIEKAAEKIKKETNAEIDYGFKIYSVKDVPNIITDNIEKFDSNTRKLFESKLLTEEEKNAILTTYKVFDGKMLHEKVETINLSDSIGYKVGSILYLLDEITSSSVIKNIIERLDSDRDFAINKIVIYGYSQLEGKYRTELKENLKTYTNKKSATIDVEVRY